MNIQLAWKIHYLESQLWVSIIKVAGHKKGREDQGFFSIIFTVLELSYLEADGFNLENKKNGMQFRPPRATQFQF